MYYLYHIPGKKIGVTRDLKERVERQQGYGPNEYDVIYSTEDIDEISANEISMQRALGYRVDEVPYNKLKFNNNNMNINVTEMTTTFPCPVNKLKGQLMDNKGMSWETEFGECILTSMSIEWIIQNVKTSQYSKDRCYVYNKAFARWFDNNDPYQHTLDNAKKMNDQYNGRTIAGALAPTGVRQENCKPECEVSQFELIREWASERGLYDKGDPKTQALKLVEEVGETCRAILKEDHKEVVDGIGDCVVVLTNLAELMNTNIETCIDIAYNEISNRTGKMVNGTFKKD